MSLSVKVENNRLVFGSASISFQRTLRIPEDGKTYPLPPSFGFFPIHKIDDYIDKVPEEWKKHGGVFLPMFQREAMWIQFDGKPNDPKACKVAIGKVNSISGKPWNQKFVKGEQQDYVVIPDQPWLDGINAGDGYIKQFVAMPLGGGYTVEAQVTGKEDVGGLQVIVYNPKPNRFKPQPQPQPQPIWNPKPQPQPQPLPQPIPHYYPNPQPQIPPHAYPPPAMAPNVPMFSPFAAPMMQSAAPAIDMMSAAPPAMKESAAPVPKMKKAESSMPRKASPSAMLDSFVAPQAAPAALFGFAAPPANASSVYSQPQNYQMHQQQQQIFPIAPPLDVRQEMPAPQEAKEMGLAAGGKMKQSIYQDKHGIDTWDESNFSRVFVHIVNSAMYKQITGKEPPATPIDASAYTNFGYPWYDLYDEHVPSVGASGVLSQVKSVSEIDKQKYGYDKGGNNQTVNIPANQVNTIVHKDEVRDGDW